MPGVSLRDPTPVCRVPGTAPALSRHSICECSQSWVLPWDGGGISTGALGLGMARHKVSSGASEGFFRKKIPGSGVLQAEGKKP